EFEFFPTDFMRERIEELEFVAAFEENGIRMLLEVDLRTLFGGEKELKREVLLENTLLEDEAALAMHFQELIGEMVENPGRFSGFRSCPSARGVFPLRRCHRWIGRRGVGRAGSLRVDGGGGGGRRRPGRCL